jgi:hypothetical protein
MGLMYPRIHGLLHGGAPSCDLISNIFSLYEFENSGNLGFDSVGAITVDLTNFNGVTQAAGIINFSSEADATSLQYFEASLPVSTFDLNQENWTMALWAKANNVADGATQTIFHINTAGTTYVTIAFIFSGEVNGHILGAGLVGPITQLVMADPEVWHHYVLIKEGTVAKMYVDGVITPYFRNDPIPTIPQDGTTFLRLYRGISIYLDGNIDQMATWERALTQDEIDCLYNSGSGTNII